MPSDDALTRARKLMALATRSPSAEEGRSAAVQAVRIIEEHDLLAAHEASRVELGLSGPPADLVLEVGRLREQVRALKAERADLQRQLVAAPSAELARSGAEAVYLNEIAFLRSEVERLEKLPLRAPPAPAPPQLPVAPPAPRSPVHRVSAGETPMSIATRYTGDPRAAPQLVAANSHKPLVVKNGWWTFAGLRAGEYLRLPVGWS